MKHFVEDKSVSRHNAIELFLHCGRCRRAGKKDKLVMGQTPFGFQVWCEACKSNVLHVDFRGQQLPANWTTDARPGDPAPLENEAGGGCAVCGEHGRHVHS